MYWLSLSLVSISPPSQFLSYGVGHRLQSELPQIITQTNNIILLFTENDIGTSLDQLPRA